MRKMRRNTGSPLIKETELQLRTSVSILPGLQGFLDPAIGVKQRYLLLPMMQASDRISSCT